MKFLGQAEGHFLAANKADPGDHLAEFYLAYHYAQTRDTARATEHVRQGPNSMEHFFAAQAFTEKWRNF